jgi:glycosyltransferase involved in cell wall biosynthesis
LLTRNFIIKYSKGFVAVSNEILALSHIKKYKKDNIVIPNSLNLVEYPILKRSDKGNVIPHILFMGTFDYPWHGIDKIIQLAQKTEDKLFFHIIGSDGKNYIDLKNVKFYGYLSREEYTKIVSKCDIGIGTLALHRKKMNETSALKVLEYLAYGLPIIIGSNDTAFFNIKRLPKWVLKLPNKENNVLENIDRIVDFCYEIKNYVVCHKDVEKYIDSLKLEKQRMEFFKKILQEA